MSSEKPPASPSSPGPRTTNAPADLLDAASVQPAEAGGRAGGPGGASAPKRETAREAAERLIATNPRFKLVGNHGQGYVIVGARPPDASDSG